MKVAIPTNDSVNIFKRTGKAGKFVLAEVDKTKFNILETVLNKHSHDHDEHHHHHDDNGHSHDDLFESIAGCEYIVVNVVGKQLKADLEKKGINIFKTKELTVEAAILDLISSEVIK